MALSSLRLRRALSLSSHLTKTHTPSSPLPTISAPPLLSSATTTISPQNPSLHLTPPHLPFQSRLFRSSSALLSSSRFSQNNRDDEIGPDTILFEGCDYNHWLITMEFKDMDPAPTTREEMIETYLQTLAKVVGRSVSSLPSAFHKYYVYCLWNVRIPVQFIKSNNGYLILYHDLKALLSMVLHNYNHVKSCASLPILNYRRILLKIALIFHELLVGRVLYC